MTVAVLGAGLAGCIVALELADRGERVVVFERRDAPMQEASRWCEGKIHLGLVYANDASFRTAQLMIDHAVNFRPILQRWVDFAAHPAMVSETFDYAVLRDSMLSPAQLEAHFGRVERCIRSAVKRSGDGYIGTVTGPLVQRADPAELGYEPERVTACYTTAERAVDTHLLADLVSAAVLSHPNIEVCGQCEVRCVQPHGQAFSIEIAHAGQVQTEGPFGHVVNALWANRPAVDATLGLPPGRPFINRLKLGVNVWLGKRAPGARTVTYVHGPYGDMVRFPSGRVYLSWYPSGMIGSRANLEPIDWQAVVGSLDRDQIAQDSVAALRGLAPGLDIPLNTGPAVPAGDAKCPVAVEGGVIFAWGNTDIDDRASELHQRHDIGPVATGKYISLDSGKYTTAPGFALQVADLIRPQARQAALLHG